MDDISLPSSIGDDDDDVCELASEPRSMLSLPPSLDSSIVSDVEDVDLPPAVDSDTDGHAANGFDDDLDGDLEGDDLVNQLAELHDSASQPYVPHPDIAKSIHICQDVAEFYSPPRVLCKARSLGLRGQLSLDLLTHWDFRLPSHCALSLQLLKQLNIMVLILSPPCTMFSALQRMWNFKRMAKCLLEQRWSEAMGYLGHAMQCALAQHHGGRFFVFEHPASASSWSQPIVQQVAALHGVHCVVFDQCMTGLRSKVRQAPMRKRTRLMTNNLAFVRQFSGLMCDGRHEHQLVQGSEGGVRRSVWAQLYPEPMVDRLAAGAQECLRV